jgi:hypothetical protein
MPGFLSSTAASRYIHNILFVFTHRYLYINLVWPWEGSISKLIDDHFSQRPRFRLEAAPQPTLKSSAAMEDNATAQSSPTSHNNSATESLSTSDSLKITAFLNELTTYITKTAIATFRAQTIITRLQNFLQSQFTTFNSSQQSWSQEKERLERAGQVVKVSVALLEKEKQEMMARALQLQDIIVRYRQKFGILDGEGEGEWDWGEWQWGWGC